MTYKLHKEEQRGNATYRIYINETTGSQIETKLIYTDQEGKKFWGFVDLYKIPMIRIAMSKHIANLYGVGLSLKDILDWCNEEKALLRSTDPEKYEKLYSLILEKERLANFTADPIKQHLALCTVYVLEDEERIDYFDESVAERKLKAWQGFPEMVGFFLSWHNDHIRRYMKSFQKISKTVSILQEQNTKQ